MAALPRPPGGASGRTGSRLLSLGALSGVAILLVAFASRGPFTAVGPLLPLLQREFGLSTTLASVLAAVPIVCFGMLAPLVPLLTRRIGLHRAVLVGLGVLAVGILTRTAGAPGLFLGTLVVGVGITVVNVVVPAVTKADFPTRQAIVTGLATTAFTISASLGSGLALPLASVAGGAVGGLLLWLVPVLVALLLWAVVTRRPRQEPATQGRRVRGLMLRDPVGLAVTLFFGFQCLTFYTLVTWLPTILHQEAGLSETSAGALVAVAMALGGPTSFLVPWLAARRASQGMWVVAVTSPTAVGLLGLTLAPAAAPVLWTLIWGIANGWSFPLALVLVLLRTRQSDETAKLSATTQCFGYLLAAAGPLAVGALFDVTASWTLAMVILAALLVPQLVFGWIAGRPGFVGDTAVPVEESSAGTTAPLPGP